MNAWEGLLLHGAHWWECVSHLLHNVGVCLWEREREREQCVILWLAEAQELPSGSSHAASICYVTLLFCCSVCLSPSVSVLAHAEVFSLNPVEGKLCPDTAVETCHNAAQNTLENDPTYSTFFFFCGPYFFDCARKQILLCTHAATNHPSVSLEHNVHVCGDMAGTCVARRE